MKNNGRDRDAVRSSFFMREILIVYLSPPWRETRIMSDNYRLKLSQWSALEPPRNTYRTLPALSASPHWGTFRGGTFGRSVKMGFAENFVVLCSFVSEDCHWHSWGLILAKCPMQEQRSFPHFALSITSDISSIRSSSLANRSIRWKPRYFMILLIWIYSSQPW